MPTHFADVTAETTDNELERPITAARDFLNGAVRDRRSSDELVAAVYRVAEAEALAQIAYTVRNIRRLGPVIGGGTVEERIRDFLISRLCQRSEDTWSGRGKNELARVKADAVRDAISNTLELL